MKTSFFIYVILAFAGLILIQGKPVGETMQKKGTFFPAEVKKVIDSKCYGCHSAQGQSKDAKDALMWDSLPNLNKSRMVATLDDIVKELRKNGMPPEAVVKKYPEMKLLDAESKILQSWAVLKADSLLK